MSEPFVIIGAGECGLRAAQALRERGFAGEITLVGNEPHLPYERPPLSKDILTGAATPTPRTVSDAAALAAAGIACLTLAPATRIDRTARRVELADGRTTIALRQSAEGDNGVCGHPSCSHYPVIIRGLLANSV